jgi:hypothetical protein
MIRAPKGTILYDIRKIPGQEGYNSFCDGSFFAPRDMKITGCGTGNEQCVPMTEDEKKQQSPIFNNINISTLD